MMKKSKTSILLILLGTVCAIGLLLVSYGYFSLRAVDDALKTQDAIDSSFSVAIKAGTVAQIGTNSTTSNVFASHLAQTAEVRQAVSRIADNLQSNNLIIAALWIVAFAFTLILLRLDSNPSGGRL
jgi:hypothetical protein